MKMNEENTTVTASILPYLPEGSGGEIHFNGEHNGDPNHRTDDHEPSHHHGPAGVGVVLIRHPLPLVQTNAQNKLVEGGGGVEGLGGDGG